MKHTGTGYIETPRLILRRFVPEDAGAMYRNWASDPDVTKYLTWPTHESEDISRMVLSDWVSHYSEENYYQWAIVYKELGEPIGSIAVVNMHERVGKAEVGYCMGRAWWHQGIMTEALSAVVDFLFKEVGVNRVEACHDPCNPHSGDVMRKCGMQYEGTQRQAGINNQGLCDMSWYAILAGDRRER
jgi:ribosomal-protein-alanine N-acetyltransferase